MGEPLREQAETRAETESSERAILPGRRRAPLDYIKAIGPA